MDEHNVHHFWGISPAIDFLQLLSEASTSSGGQAADQAAPLKLLQLASYDPRHTLTTICRATRHAALSDRPVHLYVHEEEPEVLARHLLLTAVLLDDSLLARERMETFLELHGNALLREKTAAYLGTAARPAGVRPFLPPIASTLDRSCLAVCHN